MTTNHLRAAIRLAVAACALTAALAGCSAGTSAAAPAAQVQYSPSSVFSGAVLTTPYSLPTATFTDTSGAPATLKAPGPGNLTLVFYGFTHCADDCPTTLADIASALRGMPPAQQERIGMDFVTSDPWRDTPAVIRTWLNQYNPRFNGYTASWDTIHATAAALGISLDKPASLSGDYQVTHGLQVLGFTPDGKAHIEWLIEDIQVLQLRHDLQLILSGTPIR
jgi:protein SCO1/2